MPPQSRDKGDGPFAFLSRRAFLKAGLVGGGVVLGAGAGLWAIRGSAPDVSGLRVLSAHRYRTLTALAHTHLPGGGPFAQGADCSAIARAFDGFLADEPQENVRNLEAALTLLEFGPLLFDHRLTTFSNLSEAERLAHWQGWMVSERLLRRQVALAFRKFLSLVFYDQPSIWPAIGYPGPVT